MICVPYIDLYVDKFAKSLAKSKCHRCNRCLGEVGERVVLDSYPACLAFSFPLRACHFQSRYLSLTCHFDTCISPNVYRPPVTLSPPVTPWVSLPSLALALDPDPLPTLPTLNAPNPGPIGTNPSLSAPSCPPFASIRCFADPLEFVTLASVT